MTILYADDDDDDVDAFRDALRKISSDHRLLTAGNGLKCLDLLQHGAMPDYIFLDINMPQMNGWQTLTAIRREFRFNDVPVFIFSTVISVTDAAKVSAEGGNGCAKKPDTLHELYRYLLKVIK